jgi:hypothetical protein
LPLRRVDSIMDLEIVLMWCLYVGALEARKKRQHQGVVCTKRWRQDLASIQLHLASHGLTL